MRDYGLSPTVWDGDPECEHVWGERVVPPTKIGKQGSTETVKNPKLVESMGRPKGGQFCQLCSAWLGCLGLEPSPELYVKHIVDIFREVRRTLRDDGTVWLNIGDSYWGGKGKSGYELPHEAEKRLAHGETLQHGHQVPGYMDMRPSDGKHPTLKPKDLCLIPFRLAIALQADGWWVRSDIIWAKTNPMPESVRDRPTKSHEYIFLLTKSKTYYYDQDAIREESQANDESRKRAEYGRYDAGTAKLKGGKGYKPDYLNTEHGYYNAGRNKRTVWTISTEPFSGAKLLADYVGKNGKPYKASPDCPIHGHLADPQSQQTGEYGGQQDSQLKDTPDTANNHAKGQPAESASNPFRDCEESQISQSNDDERIVESKNDSKNDALTRMDEPQRHHDTTRTQEKPDCNWDLPGLSCSPTAIDHSNQNHKKARVPETSPSYSVSEEKSSHIGRRQAQPEKTCLDAHTGESNTLADSASHAKPTDPSAGTPFHSSGKYTSGITSDNNGNTKKCTCQEIKVDHFAVFPTKLVEPMILAATSPQACPHCGAGWKRVVEKGDIISTGGSDKPGRSKAKSTESGPLERRRADGSNASQTTTKFIHRASNTVGWQPSCSCENNDGSAHAVVLDPFAGSGTTCAVAKKLGRAYVGIEQNSDYSILAEKRIAETDVEADNDEEKQLDLFG